MPVRPTFFYGRGHVLLQTDVFGEGFSGFEEGFVGRGNVAGIEYGCFFTGKSSGFVLSCL